MPLHSFTAAYALFASTIENPEAAAYAVNAIGSLQIPLRCLGKGREDGRKSDPSGDEVLAALVGAKKALTYKPQTDWQGKRMLRRLKPMCIIALLTCWLAADRLVAQRSAASALRGPDVEALLQQGKPTEALPILNQLYKAEPHNIRVCYQLGLAHTQLQEFI